MGVEAIKERNPCLISCVDPPTRTASTFWFPGGLGSGSRQKYFVSAANGAEVDWEGLGRSGLSTSERVTVDIAHCVARMETHGGSFPGPNTGQAIVDAVDAIRRG